MSRFTIIYGSTLQNYLMFVITMFILHVETECRLMLVKKTLPPNWWKMTTTRHMITAKHPLEWIARALGRVTRYTTANAERVRNELEERYSTIKTKAPIFELFRRPTVSRTATNADRRPVILLDDIMTSDVPFVIFNNGQKYPMFGLGTWKVRSPLYI